MRITNENMKKFYELVRKGTVEIKDRSLFNQLMAIQRKGHQLFEQSEPYWKLQQLETEIWLLQSRDSVRR
jgi:hypothetical protein